MAASPHYHHQVQCMAGRALCCIAKKTCSAVCRRVLQCCVMCGSALHRYHSAQLMQLQYIKGVTTAHACRARVWSAAVHSLHQPNSPSEVNNAHTSSNSSSSSNNSSDMCAQHLGSALSATSAGRACCRQVSGVLGCVFQAARQPRTCAGAHTQPSHTALVQLKLCDTPAAAAAV